MRNYSAEELRRELAFRLRRGRRSAKHVGLTDEALVELLHAIGEKA